MPVMSFGGNACFVRRYNIREHPRARARYFQRMVPEVEGHAIAVDDVQAEIARGPQQGARQNRHDEIITFELPEGQVLQTNRLGDNRTHDALHVHLLTEIEPECRSDVVGNDSAVRAGIDYEGERPLAVDHHFDRQMLLRVGRSRDLVAVVRLLSGLAWSLCGANSIEAAP